MKTHVTLLLSMALVLCGSYECLSQYNDLHDFNCSTDGCFRQGSPQGPEVLAQGRDGNLYGTMTGGGANNLGTFFRATPDGSVTALYNFDNDTVTTGVTHGNTPVSGVTLGWTDGNFYGTTLQGGNGGIHAGTVFKMTPSGTISFLHNFTGTNGTTCPTTNKPDGGSPYAPPIQASDNRFYGVTSIGTAYSIGSSGGFKALCSLASGSVLAPFGALAPVTQASNGQFYGTSTTGNGTVFRFSSSGTTKIVYAFELGGKDDGSGPIGPVIQASDTKLYGTTFSDYTRQSGEVFSMTLGGSISSPMLHTFDRNSDAVNGYRPMAGVVEATDRNFYGSTQNGGDPICNCGVLFKLTKGGGYSVLHIFHLGEPSQPFTTQFQHTNGKIYGLLKGANNADGAALYVLDVGLSPFVRLRTTSGKAGQVIPIQVISSQARRT